jgi:hypothetical protein
VTLGTGSLLVTIGNSAAAKSFAGCTSLKTFGIEGANFKEGLVEITGAAATDIKDNSFDGCTSISAVKIVSNGAETYTGSIFSGCTGIKELTLDGAHGGGMSFDFGAANKITSITNLIWNIATMPDAEVDFAGLEGLEKLTVTKEITTAIAAATAKFPTAKFTTLEIKDDNQDENQAAIFGTLPNTVKNVIIGTGPVTNNPLTTLAPLDIGNNTPAALFNSAVNNITFTGRIGTIGTSVFGTLTGPVTLSINVAPVAAFTGVNVIETVNLGPNTPAFAATVFDSNILKEILVNPANTALCNGNAGDGVLYGKVNGAPDKLIQYPPMRGALEHEYAIPNTVITIGAAAFGPVGNANTRIKILTVPESVKTIEGAAFSFMTGLETVNWEAINATNVNSFPGNVRYINIGNKVENIPGAFLGGNNRVTSVTVPSSVIGIGAGAFSTAAALATVNFNADNLKSSSAFDLSAVAPSPITTVNIGNNVTAIPNTTFKGAQIGSVNLKGVISIGENAFEDCTFLASITIEAVCRTILQNAFLGCTSLADVWIYSKSLNIIDVNAFLPATAGADNLKTIYDSAVGGSGHYVYDNTGGALKWKKDMDL